MFGIGYRFDEKTRLVSEFEVEHAVASSGDSGEMEVEQFYIDHQLTDSTHLKTGLFLIPAGLLNENHEPNNFFGVERTNIGSTKAISPGKHNIKYEFIAEAPKPGTGGICRIYVDDVKVAEGKIPKTVPFMFSADEGTDVGMDGETCVSNDYKEGENHFSGKIAKVVVSTAELKLSEEDKKKIDEANKARADAAE